LTGLFLVMAALSAGARPPLADLQTAEGVVVAPVQGAAFGKVALARDRGHAYLARGDGWAVGVLIELVPDAVAAAPRLYGAVGRQKPGAAIGRWDLVGLTNLRGLAGTRVYDLATLAGAIAPRDGSVSLVVVASDERLVTIMASAAQASLADQLSHGVAEALRFEALQREPRLVGCHEAVELGTRRLCLSASGAFSSCGGAAGEARCVSSPCEQPIEGRWYTSRGVLYLNHDSGRTLSGAYEPGAGMAFDGLEWRRVETCTP
jgi:hypothetical protein